MYIGTVDVYTDGDIVTVTYTITDPDWTLELTHLWIGDCGDLPTNNPGNPLIGQFPYSESHPGATEYSYTIDVSTLDGFCIAAHAEVNGTTSETAWAEGMPFVGKYISTISFPKLIYIFQDSCGVQNYSLHR